MRKGEKNLLTQNSISGKKKKSLEDDEIKTFSNEEKQTESIANRAAPKELLKEVIPTEGNDMSKKLGSLAIKNNRNFKYPLLVNYSTCLMV